MVLAMAGLCLLVSWSWLFWLILTSTVIGFRHPPAVDEVEPLTAGRKWICAICAVALVLCVMPTPIEQVLLR
jgi:hypothetical protein